MKKNIIALSVLLVTASSATVFAQNSRFTQIVRSYLNQQYGAYDSQNSCWNTTYQAKSYCMQIAQIHPVDIEHDGEASILVLTTAKNQPLVGLFEIEVDDGKAKTDTATPHLLLPSMNQSNSSKWKMTQMGDDLWGWRHLKQWKNGQTKISATDLYLPFHDVFSNRGSVITQCNNDSTQFTGKLVFNRSNPDQDLWPLSVVGSGKINSIHYAKKSWAVPGNENRKSYDDSASPLNACAIR